jgi:outer membrane protein assembly factor BamE (lipoprotein component of BamABCDE complex)
MKSIIFGILLLHVFITGCASSGRELSQEDVAQLGIGMTSNQVERLIGTPENISSAEGGKTYYLYYHGSAVGFMGATKGKMHMLNLTFDSRMILTHIDKNITHKSSKPFGSSQTDKIERNAF